MKVKENRSIEGTLLGYWDENGFYVFIQDVLNEDGTIKTGFIVLPMTEQEINQNKEKIKQIEKNKFNNQYKEDRSKNYPSFADQFDLLYHGGYDAWKEKIDSVKNQFPKPII